MAENEKSKSESTNICQEQKKDAGTQEPKRDGLSSQTQTELLENEVSMEEAKQNGQAEPPEVAAAEMTTAGTSKGSKKDDAGKGWRPLNCLHSDC